MALSRTGDRTPGHPARPARRRRRAIRRPARARLRHDDGSTTTGRTASSIGEPDRGVAAPGARARAGRPDPDLVAVDAGAPGGLLRGDARAAWSSSRSTCGCRPTRSRASSRASGARHLILGTGPRRARSHAKPASTDFPTTTVDALAADPDDVRSRPTGRRSSTAWPRPSRRRPLRARLHVGHDRHAEGRDARPRQRRRLDRVVPPDRARGWTTGSSRCCRCRTCSSRRSGCSTRSIGRRRHPLRPQPQPAGHLRCAPRPPGDDRWSSCRRCSTCSGAPSSARSRSAAGRRRSTAFARIARRLPFALRRLCSGASTSSSAATSGCSCRPGAFLPPALQQALGGPRRHRPPGLRRDRDRHRRVQHPRRPRARHRRAAAGRHPDAPRRRRRDPVPRPDRLQGLLARPRARPPQAFTDDGWYRTGDIGRFDDAGRLILSGRIKDIIVLPNGFNVYPEDIENALRIAGLPRPRRDRDAAGPHRGGRPARPLARRRRGTRAATKVRGLDAAVKAANATLGPNQRIAGWRLWPDEDFPRTHTLKIKRDPRSAAWAATERRPVSVSDGA